MAEGNQLEQEIEDLANMHGHTIKSRSCLMCHKEFESAWAGERICKGCKSQAGWRNGGNGF